MRASPTTSTTDGRPQGVTDEDLLHSSQSAHFHCSSRAIRWPGEVDKDDRRQVQRWFDQGDLEPVPVQVTTRNRMGDAVRVRSDWDGVQLHLDICSTQQPRLGFRSALGATMRYYGARLSVDPKLTILVLLALAMVVGLLAGTLGVV